MVQIIPLMRNARAKMVLAQGPFDEAKSALDSKGYGVASLEEVARARMEQGPNSKVSRVGGFTREAMITLPNGKVYLTKRSFILENAKYAVDCTRAIKEVYLSEEQLKQSLDGALELPDYSGFISTRDNFDKNEITKFIFGKYAGDYGRFLDKKVKVHSFAFCSDDFLADKDLSSPFVRQVHFTEPDADGVENFHGVSFYLHLNNFVFGVK